MTKEQLEQLKFLSREMVMLEHQISDVQQVICSDTVMGSSVNFPYVYRVIAITGVDMTEYDGKIKRLRKQLDKRKKEVIDLIFSINDYIDSVNDSEIRQLLYLKYVEGLTWGSIAKKLHYADESVPRKKMDRYLK